MIDLYYWPTPNGHKITIALEELGLEYRAIPINIGRGEQFEPAFLAISPNNRMPAIVDHAPADGGGPLSVFESGAILLYLADKTGALIPGDLRGRTRVTEWLMWQMGGLGPMLGQVHHFRNYAPETIPYAVDRYTREAVRLYRVLDGQLHGRDWIAGDYSIADIAAWPWVRAWRAQGIDLADFANVADWHVRMKGRPAVRRGVAVGRDWSTPGVLDEEARRHLFGQK